LNIHGGALGEHLGALDHIAKELGGELPLLMTVFTPLSVAAQLAGSSQALQGFIAEHPASVHHALEAITQTFAEFAAECLKAGADGLFFATNGWATYDGLTDEEYAEFGRPYDLRLLEAVPDAEFHVLHVCGSNNMLSDLADYPVAAFNWDTQDDTNIWLLEGLKTTGRTVIGGVPQRGVLLEGSPEEVAEEARWTLSAMAGTRWMLGPGCTISPESPEANIRALRDSYRS
jgi:uroporphyrinogen decarboxylase